MGRAWQLGRRPFVGRAGVAGTWLLRPSLQALLQLWGPVMGPTCVQTYRETPDHSAPPRPCQAQPHSCPIPAVEVAVTPGCCLSSFSGSGMGLVTRRKCSSTQDTVCDCIQGHFCKAQEGDHCVLCEPHSTCLAGQRVKERGELWWYIHLHSWSAGHLSGWLRDLGGDRCHGQLNFSCPSPVLGRGEKGAEWEEWGGTLEWLGP